LAVELWVMRAEAAFVARVCAEGVLVANLCAEPVVAAVRVAFVVRPTGAGSNVPAFAGHAFVPVTHANSALWLADASDGGTRWLEPVIVTSERR
jgi:hypothetical protein